MQALVKQISDEFKAELQKLYGDELAALILFGSHARGDSTDDSDIDFAVVLKNTSIKTSTEIFRISPASSELGLKYRELISIFPISSQRLGTSQMPIFQEIRKDGIYI